MTEPASSMRVEFAVNINQASDLSKIGQALEGKGFKLVAQDVEAKTVQLEFEPGTKSELGDVQTLQRYLEEQTGFITVIKGLGQHSSAVAELRPPEETMRGGRNPVMGVVRLSQLEAGQCYADALLSGFNNLSEREFSLAIHEFGDLSAVDYQTIGEPVAQIAREAIGKSKAEISVRSIIPDCDVVSMIGRSVAVTELSTNRDVRENILSAGVIARASIIDANKKQFCSCSGKTLWEERLDKKSE